MKKIVWLACLWPACAFAQAELASLLLWAFGVAAVVWAAFATLVALQLFDTTRNRLIAFLFVLVAPLGWWHWVSPAIAAHRNAPQRQDEASVAASRAYVARACASGVSQASLAAIVARDGLRIDTAAPSLQLAGAPPVERYSSLAHWWVGETKSRSALEFRHFRQYEQALHWWDELRAALWVPGAVDGSVAFVEWWDTSGYAAHAMASRDWWSGPGWRRVAPADLRPLAGALADPQSSRPRWLALRVVDLQARYVLSVDDVSTLEDRRNWVARQRIRLRDGADGPTVAEYVVFSVYWLPSSTTRGQWLPEGCRGREAIDYDAIPNWQERQRAPFVHFLRDIVRYVPDPAR